MLLVSGVIAHVTRSHAAQSGIWRSTSGGESSRTQRTCLATPASLLVMVTIVKVGAVLLLLLPLLWPAHA